MIPPRWGLGLGLALFAIVLVLPPPADLSVAGWRAAAVALLMAMWWMSEAIPIAATALVPLVLFPSLGIADLSATAAPYGNPLIFLFLGGVMVALAMERWNLHRRLALLVIHRLGTGGSRIVAGFMIASAFCSMWISNTATAMMMMPIGLSVTALLDKDHEASTRFATAVMLGIAYACSLGGMATLVGTPTNALLAGFLLETWEVEIGFAAWLAIALPVTIIGLLATWWLLTHRLRDMAVPGGRRFIADELAALGPMKPAERRIAWLFGLTALAWMTRPWLAGLVPGLSDPSIAVAAALLLFVSPAGDEEQSRLLDWDDTARLPWGVLVLFGGGFTLASAVNKTGLAAWIGGRLQAVETWPIVALVFLLVVTIVLLTELTSNTATTAAFLPVVASLAVGIGQDPRLLLIPATLAASCAFMLPVATPPNAIVYGSGVVSARDMARTGSGLNVVLAVVVTALCVTLLPLVLDVSLGIVPDWAIEPQ
ncbi:MAG: DASS family sodium-coupled anion symporter [Acidobacteriota bacterium]